MKYCKGYKYQLRETESIQTGIMHDAETDLVTLKDGLLTVRKYFAWDGCSGPTWDDRTNMRACLFHDALYYLMRLGLLPETCRQQADDLLRDVMLADGAAPIRAMYYHFGVDRFAAPCARPPGRKVYEAPYSASISTCK